MKLNLRLSHKGLILVIVPIVFEIVFVVILAHMLREAEAGMVAENHSRAIVTSAHDLEKQFYDAGASLAFYRMTKDESFLKRYFKARNENIPDHLRRMRPLLTDPWEVESFARIGKATVNGIKEMDNCLGRINSGMRSFFIQDSRRSLDDLLSEVHALVQHEKQVQDAAPLAQADARERVVYVLFVGVLFSVFIGLSMAIFFNQDIINRLNVLMANTKRLTMRAPLLPAVAGEDEIAHLDNVFHEMAKDLDDANRHKQEMIAMVSHDLRSPLMSVQVSLALMSEGAMGELPDDAKSEAARAERSTKRLIKMINDLLDIERLDGGKIDLTMAELDIASVVRNSVASVDALARARGITIVAPEDSHTLMADSERLEQVITNLLSNAIKFSPENGAVNIATASVGPMLEVTVSDNGPGVPPEMRDQIFERFKQAGANKDAEKAGSGLGLSIARAIVVEHGGTIGVRSNNGKGSIFWFKLPATKSPATAIAPRVL